jgi:hypothetical protein
MILNEPAAANIKHGRPSHTFGDRRTTTTHAVEGDDNGGKVVTWDDYYR